VKNQVERWLADEEKRLLDASPGWLRQIISFALSAGLRQGEILDLSWPELTSEGHEIIEQKNQEGHPPLNKKALGTQGKGESPPVNDYVF
jgi:integrase